MRSEPRAVRVFRPPENETQPTFAGLRFSHVLLAVLWCPPSHTSLVSLTCPQVLSKPKFSGVEKIKTIGSTYMAAAGLSASPGQETNQVALTMAWNSEGLEAFRRSYINILIT